MTNVRAMVENQECGMPPTVRCAATFLAGARNSLMAEQAGAGRKTDLEGRNVAVFSTRVRASALEIRPIRSAYALPPTGRQAPLT